MEKAPYLLLLNDRLQKDILSQPPKSRERILEKLSFLENGMWDAGVRVKKLKGPSDRVIFEARISKGDRLIFTLGKHANRTCIYLWGAVHHDDISSKARTIYPDNAPFLHFEASSEENLDDLYIDALSEEFFTQEAIEQKVLEDYGPQKWMHIGDEQLKRFLQKAHPDFFELFLYLTDEQEHVLKLKPPVLLSGTAGSGKTTLAVYYLVRGSHTGQSVLFVTCSNFLKDYSEKLYRGLILDDPSREKNGGTVRFVLLRELVLEILAAAGHHQDLAREVDLKEFIVIFNRHSLARKYDPELVWEEIRAIIKGANPPVSIRHYRDLISRYLQNSLSVIQLRQLKEALLALKPFDFTRKFERIIENKSACADFIDFVQKLTYPNQQADYATCAYILGEILRILQTKEAHLSSPLLSLQEYTELGKKRAPNFLYDRQEIYSIAEYYQSQLELEKRFDEIDLCRRAIVALEKFGGQFQWDLVVCDEVQDFSDIQLSLIHKLSKMPGELVYAGDPKQIINPSGFRWEEIKNRFYEQGLVVPDVQHLHLNFRCVGSVVKLSNALLKLKQQLVGISGHEHMEEWKFNGRPPYLIHGISEVELSKEIARTAAGQVVLVRNDQDKRRLMRALGTELVFTINEAKGLEFDTVLLWKFSGDTKSADIWRKIYAEHLLESNHHPLIRHEINLLYVAVTRARNTLIIYDGARTSPVWQVEALAPHVFMTQEREVLQQIWRRISSPREWNDQGDYFFAREYYSVAAECYRNASNDEMSDICQAHLLRLDKRHLESALLFAAWGRKVDAAQAYEDAGVYSKALPLWEALKRKDRIISCGILLMESEGNYAEAAELWVKQKRFDRAVENWKKAKAFKQLGAYYVKQRLYGEAAENYAAASMFLDAALCYKRLKQMKKAADFFVLGGDHASAVPIYTRLKSWDNVRTCYKALGDLYQLGAMHEKRKEYELAIQEFTNYAAGSQKHAQKLLEEAIGFSTSSRSMLKTAVRYAAISKHDEAANLFYAKGQIQLALVEYSKTNNRRMIAACYLALNQIDTAVDLYEEIGDSESYHKVAEILYHNMRTRSGYDRKKVQACFDAAELHYAAKRYDKALTRYMTVHQHDAVMKTALMVDGRDEEVIDFFLHTDKPEKAVAYIAKKKNLSVSLEYLKELIGLRGERYCEIFKNSQDELVLLELLAKLHREKPTAELEEATRSYLMSFRLLYRFDRLPNTFIDFVMDARYYNHIMTFVNPSSEAEAIISENVKKQMLAQKGSPHEDIVRAIALDSDATTFDAVLKNLPIDMHNYLIFSKADSRFKNALDFLMEKNEFEKAVGLCYRAKRPLEAAKLFEKIKNFKRAGDIYEQNDNLDDALRCYRKANDQAEVARIYEIMQRFDDALAIWTKLGKQKEMERVRKKRAKNQNKQNYVQKELF